MKKEKNKKDKDSSFLKENGFLIALYSVVGVLVVVAVSLTFFMPNSINMEQDKLLSVEDSLNVSKNNATSYKSADSGNNLAEIGEPLREQENKDQTQEKPQDESGTEEISLKESEQKETDEKKDETEEETESDKNVAVVIFEDDELASSDVISAKKTNGEKSKKDSNISNDQAFSDTQKMLWPLKGEIVSTYSPETLVYDKTLDQYRTNDSIDISAQKGQDVFSAFDGVVKTVSHSVDKGNYVVVDHGNDWSTTYSQLDDGIKVAKGDTITKGQQIGSIATPTNKSVLLGSHLDFQVTKNSVPVNPLEVLE